VVNNLRRLCQKPARPDAYPPLRCSTVAVCSSTHCSRKLPAASHLTPPRVFRGGAVAREALILLKPRATEEARELFTGRGGSVRHVGGGTAEPRKKSRGERSFGVTARRSLGASEERWVLQDEGTVDQYTRRRHGQSRRGQGYTTPPQHDVIAYSVCNLDGLPPEPRASVPAPSQPHLGCDSGEHENLPTSQ